MAGGGGGGSGDARIGGRSSGPRTLGGRFRTNLQLLIQPRTISCLSELWCLSLSLEFQEGELLTCRKYLKRVGKVSLRLLRRQVASSDSSQREGKLGVRVSLRPPLLSTPLATGSLFFYCISRNSTGRLPEFIAVFSACYELKQLCISDTGSFSSCPPVL